MVGVDSGEEIHPLLEVAARGGCGRGTLCRCRLGRVDQHFAALCGGTVFGQDEDLLARTDKPQIGACRQVLVFVAAVIVLLVLKRRDLKLGQFKLTLLFLVGLLRGEIRLHRRDRAPRPAARDDERDREHGIAHGRMSMPEVKSLFFDISKPHIH